METNSGTICSVRAVATSHFGRRARTCIQIGDYSSEVIWEPKYVMSGLPTVGHRHRYVGSLRNQFGGDTTHRTNTNRLRGLFFSTYQTVAASMNTVGLASRDPPLPPQPPLWVIVTKKVGKRQGRKREYEYDHTRISPQPGGSQARQADRLPVGFTPFKRGKHRLWWRRITIHASAKANVLVFCSFVSGHTTDPS